MRWVIPWVVRTMSKGVAEKDTRTRLGVEFMGRVGM